MSSAPIPQYPNASATVRGLVSTGAQTFAGDKTFTGGIISTKSSGHAVDIASGADLILRGAGDYSLDTAGSLFSIKRAGAVIFRHNPGVDIQLSAATRPESSGVRDLGSATLKWADAYIGGTIALGNSALSRVIGGSGTLNLDDSTGSKLTYGLTSFTANGNQVQLNANGTTLTLTTAGAAALSTGLTTNVGDGVYALKNDNGLGLWGVWANGSNSLMNFDVKSGGAAVTALSMAASGASFGVDLTVFSKVTGSASSGNAVVNLDGSVGAQLNYGGVSSLRCDATRPSVNMGAASSRAAVGGLASINTSVVGTGADTTEDNLMTYSLLANAMSADGKTVRVTAWGDGVSTADVTTVRGYFGATAVVTKVLTASQANTWRAEFTVTRTGATAQVASGEVKNGGTAASLAQSNSSPAETLSGAVTIKFTGQRATSSVANSIRQLGMLVEFLNQ